MSDLKMTNAGDYMSDLDEEGKWKGYPNLSVPLDSKMIQHGTIHFPKYAGYWVIGGNVHLQVFEDKKPTPEQIKNTEEAFGWEWKEYAN